ncbi:metallophosphoesterase (plasmid) [Bosea sp. F3-2]|uniref:metallophosphoesterase family protein n=1 Tax=Bosea sp. F3-2 TaxID=2599640 RepID=UPI0011EBF964|nr:metallophosphoesterase family protein [Bosea sp. F3-2]QEL26853.1 metallophosphoesterase [Bosea sp. F3-2]
MRTATESFTVCSAVSTAGKSASASPLQTISLAPASVPLAAERASSLRCASPCSLTSMRNREALDAVGRLSPPEAPDAIVIAGDIVGYGPDPAYAVEIAAQYAASGAQVVKGNHDQAVQQEDRGMTKTARDAIHWTRDQLSGEHRAFLAGLPLTVAEEDRLYVHASADEPGRWHYIHDAKAAALSFDATGARLIVCGHTHVPPCSMLAPATRPVAFSRSTTNPRRLIARRAAASCGRGLRRPAARRKSGRLLRSHRL